MKKHLPVLQMLIAEIPGLRKVSVLSLPIILMIVLFSPGLSAQTVEKLKDRIQYVEADEVPGLKSLVSERMPSIYIGTEGIQKDGNGSTLVIYCKVESIGTLYSANPDFENVKMISFKIEKDEEKNISLDLGKLSSFTKLKYVLFSFTYAECGGESDACLEDRVRAMVTGTFSGLTIVYQLSIPN